MYLRFTVVFIKYAMLAQLGRADASPDAKGLGESGLPFVLSESELPAVFGQPGHSEVNRFITGQVLLSILTPEPFGERPVG